ncbi:hypothetical protein C5C71_06420 [Rathayibacter sp. AY1C1]|uniref:hypothetical protein n=1 Tax=Rathayibacter sp. AY1C1 TaxID=2080534 RepID=UPI000CE72CEF|nr:hypothetical protein [Rathayibacter sp. AY1C1]PPH11634.1 hypothetical protein C5C71_06420 [Rathayibacter sp. AY1C1]
MTSSGQGQRSPGQSRCVHPRQPPMDWHDYVDEDDDAVEHFAEWLSTLKPFARRDVIAMMDTLEARASRGEVVIPDDARLPGDLDAIRSDPDIYELKWTLLSKKIRQYHAEPRLLPDHLVRLHLHIKVDSGRGDDSADAQQQVEIDKAVARYHDGEPSTWGVWRTPTQPPGCRPIV